MKLLKTIFLALTFILWALPSMATPFPDSNEDVESIERGTLENPYSIAEISQTSMTGRTDVWVKGYIIGYYASSKIYKNCNGTANIVLADSKNESNFNNAIAVDIEYDATIKLALALMYHNNFQGMEICVHGDILKYYGKNGVKNLDAFTFDDTYTIDNCVIFSVVKFPMCLNTKSIIGDFHL